MYLDTLTVKIASKYRLHVAIDNIITLILVYIHVGRRNSQAYSCALPDYLYLIFRSLHISPYNIIYRHISPSYITMHNTAKLGAPKTQNTILKISHSDPYKCIHSAMNIIKGCCQHSLV